jgi:hypothetical protein
MLRTNKEHYRPDSPVLFQKSPVSREFSRGLGKGVPMYPDKQWRIDNAQHLRGVRLELQPLPTAERGPASTTRVTPLAMIIRKALDTKSARPASPTSGMICNRLRLTETAFRADCFPSGCREAVQPLRECWPQIRCKCSEAEFGNATPGCCRQSDCGDATLRPIWTRAVREAHIRLNQTRLSEKG